MKINNSTAEKSIQIECKARVENSDDGPPKLKFQGYSGASVDLSDYGFDYPVVYDIAGIELKQKTPIKYEHGTTIGHTTSVRKMDNGSALRGKGVASLPGPDTDRVTQGITNGFPWEGSMGLRIPNFEKNLRLHQKGKVTVNNREFVGPLYIVNRSVLTEMTVTEGGRDSDTSFEFLNKEMRMKILNSSTPTATPEVPALEADTKDTTPAETVENSTPADTVVTPPEDTTVIANSTTDDDKGYMRVLRLLNSNPNQLDAIEAGIKKGWDDEAIENSIKVKALESMNSKLPKPPKKTTTEDAATFRNSLEASIALSFGSKPEFLEKKFGKEIVDNSMARSQMGMHELLVNAANAEGGNFNGYSDVEAVAKHLRNSGYSSFDLPDFFQKVGSIIKEERWELDAPFAPTVCKEGSNKDFRPTVRKRITGGDMWRPVAADGKLELYAAGDQKKYMTELATFGTVFTMTREELAGDDMDVIADMMAAMVEGAMMIPDYQLGQKMLEQVSAANTFWVNANNSFTNTPLTRANLSARYNALRTYTENKSGMNWDVMTNSGWDLVISPSLEETAWDIIKQDRIVADAAATGKTGDKNYWFGRLGIKVFTQMGNSSAFPTNTSKMVGDTTWMLWPTNTRFSPYEITYYRGIKTPTIEAIDLPGTLLGFGTRGFWDVKINERERQAIVRATSVA